MDQTLYSSKIVEDQPSRTKKTRRCDGFKMFLAALSFAYISKALAGVIMKSSITQIERRFDIPSSFAGLIDGAFEIGNLLVIIFVSYFGSKLHRPKLIGIGCFIMGLGSIFTAMPHFFMEYYRYSSEDDINSLRNSTWICLANQTTSLTGASPEIVGKDCEKVSKSRMWIFVLMANMLRGIGETPIVPLGVSFIDDFATEGHSSVYLGILNTVAMIGPIIGFLMTSVFARMYVDIGYVDMRLHMQQLDIPERSLPFLGNIKLSGAIQFSADGNIRITPLDARWVGAWWLSFIVSGIFSIISSIPFFFLPKIPNTSQRERKNSASLNVLKTDEGKNHMTNLVKQEKKAAVDMTAMKIGKYWITKFDWFSKSFLYSLKSILTNKLYVIFLVLTLLQISSFIGSFTYIFKFVEQQFSKSASQANFALGIITLPTMALGMFLGGYIIKRFRLTLIGITKFALFTSSISYVFLLLNFLLICENNPYAGLTLTYDGMNSVDSHIDVPRSYCNSDCSCDQNQWEPICGKNGVTYISPCLAGCKSSSADKNLNGTVFYDCSCIRDSGFQTTNHSAHLGECQKNKCQKKYYFYITFQVVSSFFVAMGSTSFIMIVLKTVQPELKSLAMGFHSLVIRALGGILAPIYYGAFIDKTCMKWSVTSCGTRGACRVYNSTLFGTVYLGLNTSLKTPALLLYLVLIYVMKKKYERKDSKTLENDGKVTDEGNQEPLNKNGYHSVPLGTSHNETPF